MSAHTDIRHGLIARLPGPLRPYASLARIDRPIGVWLLFLPGLWGILLPGVAAARSVRLVLLFAVGSLVMRAAGCVVNDLWDRDLDRRVARTASRPLASGALRARHALLFLAALLAAGLAVLLQLRPSAIVLGCASLALVALYPAAKRVTWWPQLVMGFTFGFGAPMGYLAAAGRIDLAWALIYLAAILWDLGFDTIYGFQDIEDDALAGIKSTSRRFAHAPRRFVAACYALTLLALVAAFAAARLAWPAYAALALPAALLGWQVLRLDAANPARCLALFRLNREAGLAVALAIVLGR